MSYRYGATRHPGGYTYGVGGLGVRGDAIPQSGTHGPGLLAADVVLPGEAADEFMYRVTVAPPLLTLFRYFDDSSIEAEGPPGLHTGQAERRKNGVVYGTAPFYVLIGSTLGGSISADDAVASGAFGVAPLPPPPEMRGPPRVVLARGRQDLGQQFPLIAGPPGPPGFAGPAEELMNGASTVRSTTTGADVNPVDITAGTADADAWQVLVDYSGKGRINFASVRAADATARTVGLRVVIDGRTVVDATGATAAEGHGLVGVGAYGPGGGKFQPLDFTTSLSVRVSSSLAETAGVVLAVNYEEWAA